MIASVFGQTSFSSVVVNCRSNMTEKDELCIHALLFNPLGNPINETLFHRRGLLREAQKIGSHRYNWCVIGLCCWLARRRL